MQKIGRYEVVREVGRGGMATVYLARDPAFGREVALKVLPRQFTHDPQFRVRFEREARIIAQLEHAYIVPIYDFGQEGDQPYIVMRYMAGGTLAQRLNGQPVSLAQVLPIIGRVADALDTAHKRGVVHRDLKPGNIIFDGEQHAFLTDFGIAKILAEDSGVTNTGMMIGTPEYMSPEQAMGQKQVDGRSDVYALGVILYQMLNGRHPYQADTPVGVMFKHVSEPVPILDTARIGLHPACNMVLARALAKKPEDRFATAIDLVKALQLASSGAVSNAAPPAAAPPSPAKVTAPPPPVLAPPTPPAARSLASPTMVIGQALPAIACANCMGAGLTLQEDGSAVCRFCGTTNMLGGAICPECETVNPNNEDVCVQCRRSIARYCPFCQTRNWSGAETCTACGEKIDALAYLSAHWNQDVRGDLQKSAADYKAIEAEGTKRRMADLMEVEAKRKRAITEQKERAERERQNFFIWGGVIVVVGIIFVIIFALVWMSSS